MRELPKMCVDVVMASTIDGVIGVDGNLPWYIPAELKNFVELTKGKTLIVGRKTAESLPRSMLFDDKYGRKILVATTSTTESLCDTYGSLHTLLKRCDANHIIPVIIGGASIYEQVLNNPELVCRVHLSLVRKSVKGDTSVDLNTLFNLGRSASGVSSYEELREHFEKLPAVGPQKDFSKYTMEPPDEVYQLLWEQVTPAKKDEFSTPVFDAKKFVDNGKAVSVKKDEDEEDEGYW